jgi:hypothetical protein
MGEYAELSGNPFPTRYSVSEQGAGSKSILS